MTVLLRLSLVSSVMNIPKVYIYNLENIFRHSQSISFLDAFGNKMVENSVPLYLSTQYRMAKIFLYRILHGTYKTNDPNNADLYFVPLFINTVLCGSVEVECNKIMMKEKQLRRHLTFLNETTAPLHFFLLQSSFWCASNCSGIYSNPRGLFKSFQRVSCESTKASAIANTLDGFTGISFRNRFLHSQGNTLRAF
jgi:hypothetical protein